MAGASEREGRLNGAGGGGSTGVNKAGISVGRTRVGKYELGRTLGEGTFAKVKFARNLETGENVAIKILDKEKILKHKMISQIKREISTMKLIEHPNVIRMFEGGVMASKTKIYLILEFVTGGELFDKIAQGGRSQEYFQQLINAVDYCHSRGVFHRDLKPENLLLDSNGFLKVTDFGLSEDGLLHTTCGTPNYVAPEVCGSLVLRVILFVLMAGYLPFEDSNLASLYKKIHKAEFSCPSWLSSGAKKLIKRILDPNPVNRITIAEVIENEWFKKGYQPPRFGTTDVPSTTKLHEQAPANLVVEKKEVGPVLMNAFELISTSQALTSAPCSRSRCIPWRIICRYIRIICQQGLVKRETRFASKHSAGDIISKIEEVAKPLGFNVQKQNYKLKLQGEKTGRKGHLSIATEIFEVAPSLHMVELRKSTGDTLEFHKVYKNISNGLKDIVWQTGDKKDEAGTDEDHEAVAYLRL
ncbi:unnamed protein product [Spirodela intermedia]|uniref:non-specific serine/threonine protein kinase n=1 Tax=Spirodela intermedia TaxID=51605 RepID=A0A7I8ILP8_SPIIN|nr:unnamed protein product [Spirodela intermedia]CAA6657891.1 unnamed protein product [Spirodela intermedia]